VNTPERRHERAHAGYDAYAKSTGGKTFDGRDMPAWTALPERIQEAWVAAALAIVAPAQLELDALRSLLDEASQIPAVKSEVLKLLVAAPAGDQTDGEPCTTLTFAGELLAVLYTRQVDEVRARIEARVLDALKVPNAALLYWRGLAVIAIEAIESQRMQAAAFVRTLASGSDLELIAASLERGDHEKTQPVPPLPPKTDDLPEGWR
jgi:hypothetical protein